MILANGVYFGLYGLYNSNTQDLVYWYPNDYKLHIYICYVFLNVFVR